MPQIAVVITPKGVEVLDPRAPQVVAGERVQLLPLVREEECQTVLVTTEVTEVIAVGSNRR